MTDREQLAYERTRLMVYNRAHGRCEVCGKPIEYHTYQMGHRIPQRRHFVKKYGKAIIHHHLNMAATCSLRCNNAVSIGNHPIAIEELVSQIQEDIIDGTE